MGAVAGSTAVSSLFLAQLIQHLFGAINALKMIVLPWLFSNFIIPDDAYSTMVRIMNLVNLDIIEVEPLLTAIFGEFRETAAFNDHFSEMGYESSTFFLSLGLIMLTIMVFAVWVVIRKLLQRIVRKCSDNRLTMRLKSPTSFMQTVLIFIIEASIELSLSALVCI